MTEMNLGIAVHRFPPSIGGSELYAKSLADELHRRGHEVTVFTTEHPERGDFDYDVIDYTNVVPESFGYFAWPGVLSPKSLRTLRDLDAIHAMNASMFSTVVGSCAARCFGTTAVLTTTYHPPAVQTHKRLKRLYDDVVLKRLLPQYDRLIVSSDFERQQLEEHFDLRTCTITKLHIPPIITNADHPPQPTEEFVILYVGRLDAHKGVLTLLDSIRQLTGGNSIRCVVVGEHERWHKWPSEVEERIQELDDHIEFTGFVEDDQLAEYYAAADVLVLPSAYETFGQVLAEALSYGTPIISTPVGAAPELVEEGENGFLFKHDSVEELTHRLKEIQEIETERLQRNARQTVNSLSWESTVDEFLEIYRNP